MESTNLKSNISKHSSSIKSILYFLTALLPCYLLLITCYSPAYAQQSLDFTISYGVSDPDAISGDILVNSDKDLVRSRQPYAQKIFGVLQDKPLISVQVQGAENQKPIARSGSVNVNVVSDGGEIQKGDYITTSNKPGKGQKAQTSGYVVGTALSSLEAGQTEGQIPVAIKVEFAELDKAQSANRLLGYAGSSLLQNVKDPEKFSQLLRFMVSGGIALAGFLIGFFAFARSIPKSIEAIGRNPLAKVAITAIVILNISLTVITTIIGIIGAFLILRI